jgi:hypothetical protein
MARPMKHHFMIDQLESSYYHMDFCGEISGYTRYKSCGAYKHSSAVMGSSLLSPPLVVLQFYSLHGNEVPLPKAQILGLQAASISHKCGFLVILIALFAATSCMSSSNFRLCKVTPHDHPLLDYGSSMKHQLSIFNQKNLPR